MQCQNWSWIPKLPDSDLRQVEKALSYTKPSLDQVLHVLNDMNLYVKGSKKNGILERPFISMTWLMEIGTKLSG
jgi:hypothetical protein